MKIETKFNLRQWVYRKEDYKPVFITQIMYEFYNNNYAVKYLCTFDDHIAIYFENELTAEKPKPKSISELGNNDEYFFINECGAAEVEVFRSDNRDKKCIAQGNAFLTLGEAQKEAKRREIHQRLKELANGYKFKRSAPNYFITYTTTINSMFVNVEKTEYEPYTVYFKSGSDAENAIKEIGKDVLIRDYFSYEFPAEA